MRFAQPDMLWLLWGIIPLWFILRGLLIRREKMMQRFVAAHLLPDIVRHFDHRRLMLKNFLFVFVFIFAIIALARPQWGFEWEELKRKGVDIILVVDTSKSMLTQDVKPNRLERTKLAIRDLVKKLKGDRIGLIAFAGDAFLMCPLTVDYAGFLLSLDDLSIGSVPRGGTNMEAAILTALKEYDETPNSYKAVIVVTDGDNLEGNPAKAVEAARKQEVRVYTVGIGTREGELIQVSNERGEKEFLKDKAGNYVKSRLNEKLLEEIALKTQGAYVRAAGAEFGLDVLYEKEISKIEKREFDAKMEKKYFERFQWPVAAVLILLVGEICIPTRQRKSSAVV